MEIYQLIYAATLAKYCNFSAAAEKLFITQPSLSLQIQNLEKELGFSLFYRNKRIVRLTGAGEQFIKSASTVIQEFNSLKKDVLKINEALKQNITFGSSTLSSLLFARSINSFLKTYPQVDFKLVETCDTDLIEMVRNHELNLAIVLISRNYPHIGELTLVPLQECHLCTVMMKNNKLAKREFVTLKDIEHEEMLFSSTGSVIRTLIFNAFSEAGCKPDSFMDLVSFEARITLIKDGAISFSQNVIDFWMHEPDLVLIPIKPLIDVTFALIYPADREMSFLENSLIDIICEDYRIR